MAEAVAVRRRSVLGCLSARLGGDGRPVDRGESRIHVGDARNERAVVREPGRGVHVRRGRHEGPVIALLPSICRLGRLSGIRGLGRLGLGRLSGIRGLGRLGLGRLSRLGSVRRGRVGGRRGHARRGRKRGGGRQRDHYDGNCQAPEAAEEVDLHQGSPRDRA